MKRILMVMAMMIGLAAECLAQNPLVFNNGFQYELEAGTFGGSMALTYKFAKRFSFGAGYWYGVYYWDSDNIYEYLGDSYNKNITTNYGKDNVKTTTIQQGRPNSRLTNQMYLTGQIRPMNRAFSFLFGANVGYETIQLDDYYYPYYGDKQQAFFVTPFTGFSFRMRNFYINLKGGVNMVDKIQPETTIVTENSASTTTTTEYPEIDISSLYAVMNFTWTLKLGRGYKEKQRIAEYKASHPKVKKQRDGHGWETFGKVMEGLSVGLDAAQQTLNEYNQSKYNSGYSGSSTAAGYSGSTTTDYSSSSATTNTSSRSTEKEAKMCDKCAGRGKCSFIGDVRAKWACQGTGKCVHCHGEGVGVTDYGMGTDYKDNICKKCDGKGKCSYCNGTGKCSKCNGTGKL